MRYFAFPGLVVLTCLSLCDAQSGPQSKEPEPLAILASAKFVYVEAFDGADSPGSVHDPRVVPEDREAVENIQRALHDWGYYLLTTRRSEADLVIFVRKGRVVNAYRGSHAGNAPKPESGLVAAADAGANVDMFCVYALNRQGKYSGPLWQKNLKDGLSTPRMVLFKYFKNDVISGPPLQAKERTPLNATPFPTQ
ncbi:MAG: hypothetical protein WBL50_07675 [Candidatus Acidiferrum sp.]